MLGKILGYRQRKCRAFCCFRAFCPVKYSATARENTGHLLCCIELQAKHQAPPYVLPKGAGYYDLTIKKCLWHDACVRFGCPELCRLFCDVDDVTYGGLRKIAFTRTKTLGYGGDCCDFHFYKKG